MSLDEVYRRLDAIPSECFQPNWDSYGAEPITAEAVRNAKTVAEAMHAWISRSPRGVIGPLGDGDAIEFEADCTDGRTVIIDVHDDGRISGEIVEAEK